MEYIFVLFLWYVIDNIVLYIYVMFFFAIYWSKSVFESHLSMVTNIIFNAKKANCGPIVYKLY